MYNGGITQLGLHILCHLLNRVVNSHLEDCLVDVDPEWGVISSPQRQEALLFGGFSIDKLVLLMKLKKLVNFLPLEG